MASESLPRRRSLRLSSWDYTTPAVYFVTICTRERANLFTPDVRPIVAHAWEAIPTHSHAKHVCLDEWVIMPNHFHGLIILTGGDLENPCAGLEPDEMPFPLATFYRSEGEQPATGARLVPGSVGAIVGNFKSVVARRVNRVRRTPGANVWQRGYYERIVRNLRELEATRTYIQENPRRWAEDRENLDGLLARMRRQR